MLKFRLYLLEHACSVGVVRCVMSGHMARISINMERARLQAQCANQRKPARHGSERVVIMTEYREHKWDEEYYGYRCSKCLTFIPFGCDPWLPNDEEEDDE
jgi:hypothetical protein